MIRGLKFIVYSSKGYLGAAAWRLHNSHGGLFLRCRVHTQVLPVAHIRLWLLGILRSKEGLLHDWCLLAASLLTFILAWHISLIVGLRSHFLTGSHTVLLVLSADPVDLSLFLNRLLVFCGLIFVSLLLILLVILVGVVLVQRGFAFVTTVILPNHLAHFVRRSSDLTVFPFESHSVWTIAASSTIVVPASENIYAGLTTRGRKSFKLLPG